MLKPLKMDLLPVETALRPAVDAGVNTAVTGAVSATKPRLVGRSVVEKVEAIAPGMGAAVQKNGLGRVKNLVKNNPKKAAAIATVVALGSVTGYNELVELADSDPIDSIREFFSSVLAGVDEVEAAAGLNTFTPNEDEVIAGSPAQDVEQSFVLVQHATELFDRAAASFGGVNRLLNYMAWDAVDDDLKAIVIRNATK